MSTSLSWGGAVVEVERPWEVLLAAGALGVLFQLLFWQAAPGASFPLYVALILVAVAWIARRHGIGPVGSTAALTGVTLVLAGGVAVRAEPLTTAVNMLVVVVLLGVLTQAYGSDRWLRYGLRDWLLALLRLSGHEVVGAPVAVRATRTRAGGGHGMLRKRVLPVARGIAIAAPLVALLAALLASADVIFASRLESLMPSWPYLDEAFGRLLVALVAAYVVAGGLVHMLRRRDDPLLADRAVPRVLGFTEAAIVLASINTLFATFVLIQFRHFFGGHTAPLADGMTYAEYARRGFGELVVVAGVSLAVHLALAGLTRRETGRQRWTFTALTAALTGVVLVILTSAFQRLLLYEQAFGFTRLRTLVHVFIVWLGLLLVVLLVLELADRVRLFLLASVVAVVGFALTLNLIGVDPLIARHNLARAVQGAELDVAYLKTLSPDAVPELVGALPGLEPSLARDVASAVSCIMQRRVTGDWRSRRLADVRAEAVLAEAPPLSGVCSA